MIKKHYYKVYNNEELGKREVSEIYHMMKGIPF